MLVGTLAAPFNPDVTAGLDPAIYDSAQRKESNLGKGLASTHCNDDAFNKLIVSVDGRGKPGHDVLKPGNFLAPDQLTL